MKLRAIGAAIGVTWAAAITLAIGRIVVVLDSRALGPEPRPPVVGAAPAGPSEVSIPLAAPPAPEGAVAAAADRSSPRDAEAMPASPEQEQARDQAEEVLGRMQSSGKVDDESIADFRQALRDMRPADRIEVLGAFAVAASRGEIETEPNDLKRILP